MVDPVPAAASRSSVSPLSRVAAVFVRVFERIIPDPYIFAVALTLLTALLALLLAPHNSLAEVVSAWYAGIFDILAFAFQMILILVTGYALASSAPVHRALAALAARATTPSQGIVLAVVTSTVCCYINWGFGLVVAGLISREIAKRMRIDFGWLVAGAYSGYIIWANGLSSSIALAQATHGSKLNIVEQITGHGLSLRQTIFQPFSFVPVIVLLVVMPLIFRAMQPADADVVAADPAGLADEPQAMDDDPAKQTLSTRLDRAWIFNLILGATGLAYLVWTWTTKGFALDINAVIFLFMILGLLVHWRPIAYVRAVNNAARMTGPLILQYPLYGGIMGMMTATGLAGVIAKAFTTFSTAGTLPFWSFISSIIISLFVPSGGGHWAVQGPFIVPAALQLHASVGAASMAVAMGEGTANMIQPFWVLPVIAIAGIGLRRVMGFTVVSFFVSGVVFGLSLLFLSPHGT